MNIDEQFLYDLYQTHKDEILRYASILVKYFPSSIPRYMDEDDLFQEAWFRIWQALDEGKFIGNLGNDFQKWSRKIILNVFRNEYNKEKKIAILRVDDNLKIGEELVISIVENAMDTDINIEDKMVLDEYLDLVLKEIKSLPASHAESLILYAIGFSYEEIAEILGISLSNARARINRGREKLKKALKDS